uniref:GTPase KRas isoform X3 n=1 Tax=Callithrix jacchus TaxID=9483 RepID=UPI0023DD6502|nr:GTPase KRas isoform X3 [Callithrix jacchus]
MIIGAAIRKPRVGNRPPGLPKSPKSPPTFGDCLFIYVQSMRVNGCAPAQADPEGGAVLFAASLWIPVGAAAGPLAASPWWLSSPRSGPTPGQNPPRLGRPCGEAVGGPPRGSGSPSSRRGAAQTRSPAGPAPHPRPPQHPCLRRPGLRSSYAGPARPPPPRRLRSRLPSLAYSHTALSRSLSHSSLKRNRAQNASIALPSAAARPRTHRCARSSIFLGGGRGGGGSSGGGSGGGDGGGGSASTPGPRHFGLGTSAAQALKEAAGPEAQRLPGAGERIPTGSK